MLTSRPSRSGTHVGPMCAMRCSGAALVSRHDVDATRSLSSRGRAIRSWCRRLATGTEVPAGHPRGGTAGRVLGVAREGRSDERPFSRGRFAPRGGRRAGSPAWPCPTGRGGPRRPRPRCRGRSPTAWSSPSPTTAEARTRDGRVRGARRRGGWYCALLLGRSGRGASSTSWERPPSGPVTSMSSLKDRSLSSLKDRSLSRASPEGRHDVLPGQRIAR